MPVCIYVVYINVVASYVCILTTVHCILLYIWCYTVWECKCLRSSPDWWPSVWRCLWRARRWWWVPRWHCDSAWASPLAPAPPACWGSAERERVRTREKWKHSTNERYTYAWGVEDWMEMAILAITAVVCLYIRTWMHLCSASFTSSSTLPSVAVRHSVRSRHHMIWDTVSTTCKQRRYGTRMYATVTNIYMYMFLNERWEGRKKEASKVKQINKAKQHSTPKAVMYMYVTHTYIHHRQWHTYVYYTTDQWTTTTLGLNGWKDVYFKHSQYTCIYNYIYIKLYIYIHMYVKILSKAVYSVKTSLL